MSTLKVTNIQHGSATNVAMVLDTAGTVKAYSTISVGNVTPSSSGAGITFPATASASSDANTLDDYEEGTWTPNQGSNLTVVGAFSSSGYYTKIGRQVTVTFFVKGATSIAVSSAGIICTNLPFTAAATTSDFFYTGTLVNKGVTSGGVAIANQTTTNLYSAVAILANDSIAGSVTYFV